MCILGQLRALRIGGDGTEWRASGPWASSTRGVTGGAVRVRTTAPLASATVDISASAAPRGALAPDCVERRLP